MAKEIITSRSNNIIKDIRALSETRRRREQGRFVLEGERFVRDALSGGFECLRLVVTEAHAQAFRGATIVSDDVFASIADTKAPQGVLGVFALPSPSPALLYEARRVLVLERVQQSDNVGALLRSAVCCGYEAALLLGECADAYSPKAVRASAGGVLRLNIFGGDITMLSKLRENDFEIIGASLSGLERENVNFPKSALIIGNEGNGMSSDAQKLCTRLVKIPILGDCESLNAAVAGGILMYRTIGY